MQINATCKRYSQRRKGRGVRQRAFDPNCNYCVLYEFMNGKCETHGSRSPSREASESRDPSGPLEQPFLHQAPDQAMAQQLLGDPDQMHEHMEQINEQTRQSRSRTRSRSRSSSRQVPFVNDVNSVCSGVCRKSVECNKDQTPDKCACVLYNKECDNNKICNDLADQKGKSPYSCQCVAGFCRVHTSETVPQGTVEDVAKDVRRAKKKASNLRYRQKLYAERKKKAEKLVKALKRERESKNLKREFKEVKQALPTSHQKPVKMNSVMKIRRK
uniref:Uncharacterized protein n=1 Tax=Ditylenchus dipsaci TaxID=166011 RepID=A0A915CTS2_9BILA